MDAERWGRVESLFHRAQPLSPPERAILLATECRGDDDLHMQIERLLSADDTPHELVDRLDSGALRPLEDPLIGRVVGHYRLIARLGFGGMGVVYRAERIDGLFRHDVAIKLIRIELATESLVRGFELERRTLAALHHPHIAQLYDGGTTPDGRPYLVMELVNGIPIDRYCDEQRLSVEERLRLFVQVCRAVHFAHQNLVVHRDLKPANILIDETGVPKLLDFGIARLLDESSQQTALSLTLTFGNILTPDYASPEQLTNGPVTTAMDVYSLGVVMYELITGRRPFRSDAQTPVEWHRSVLERTPTRPSSRVVLPEAAPMPDFPATSPDEIAARSGSTPGSLRRRLRGDLDRIVLMALRKEPERRYGSAKDMADDIERHFSGHPVLARPDSFGYRTGKFVQRNRVAVALALAVVVALVCGLVFALRGEARAQAGEALARAQAQHARVEAESFQGIAEFLMDTFLTSTPTLDEERLEPKRHRIEMHAARLRREYVGQDHLRANLLDSLGRVAQRLGLFDDAQALVQEALEIRTKAFGENSLEYALSLRSAGILHYERGELEPAVKSLEKALLLHRTHTWEAHTDVASLANDLAACLRGLGRVDEAEKLHREALALRRQANDGSVDVAESLNNLAGVDLDRNDLPAAAQKLEEALAIRRGILGPEDPLTLQSMSNLASTYWRLDRKPESHALLDEVETGYRALHVDGEEALAQVLANRGGMLIAERKYSEAERRIGEALALQVRRLGPRHPAVASTLVRQAQVQQALGHTAEARETWDRVVSIRREPGTSPRYLGQSLYEYGLFLRATQAREAARDALREAVTVLRSSASPPTLVLGRAELVLGELLVANGELADARPHLDAAVTILSGFPGLEEEVARARAVQERCGPP